ncbi:uncharacterized protein LOC143212945 isoform X2 [Lasioglossum baleicum]
MDTLEDFMSKDLKMTKKPSMIITNKNKSANNANGEIQGNATKVPIVNRDNEKLKPIINHRKRKKSNKNVANVGNDETTSDDIPKSQEVQNESDQYNNEKTLNGKESETERNSTYGTNENIIGRSKRIRKQTNFDNYITSSKKDTNCKKKTSVNIISGSPEASSTVKSNTKKNGNSKNSITPVLTRESLPLHCNNVSEQHSSVKNIKDISQEELNDSCRNTEISGDCKYDEGTDSKVSTINTLICETTNLKLDHTECSDDKSLILVEQNLSSESPLTTPAKRRKGRPRKTSLQQINDNTVADAPVLNKRHSGKSYNVTSNDDLSDDSNTESNLSNSFPARRRGRPSKGRGRSRAQSTLDTEYIPKLKGPTPSNNLKSDSAPVAKDTSNTLQVTIECGKCKETMQKKQWSWHSLTKHNDMCWIEGKEPLDLDDEKVTKRILAAAIKKRKGKLSCEKCGTIKRSVNGFLSHLQFCGKSDEERQALMMKCPICDAVMMPSSMEIHERMHRQAEENKLKELKLFPPNTEKVKRKAAEKAVTKISEFTELVKDVPIERKMKLNKCLLKNLIKAPEQKKYIPGVWKGKWRKELNLGNTLSCHQIRCNFTTSSLEDMQTHFSTCNFVPQEGYLCKICKYSTNNKEEMITHIMETHGAVDEDDKCSDFEEESYPNEKLSGMVLDKHHSFRLHWTEPFHPAIQWTMEFEQRNYEFRLYENHTPNQFTLLKNADAAKYLPQLEVSMRTRTGSTNSENLSDTETSWKQWQRFEGGFDKGNPMFFVGGPIWALAWLPIPSPIYRKNPTQYIALSTHPCMQSEYSVGSAYVGHNIIQIWSTGSLDQEADKGRVPSLSYALAHDAGTIWCLEWCPSGCYQDESLNNYEKKQEIQPTLKRMGMLAAACSDGNVHIYSLPFPEELGFEKTEKHTWPIYRTDPVMTLVVNMPMYDRNKQNWQCTKLSWSKEHNHKIIAAGFSNGYIALWDLTCQSPISMQKRQNTYIVNAFQHFFAHGNAVSMVAIVPYNQGRFLASGSVDRMYKFWNTDDTSAPQSSAQRGFIADGAWMTHWPCAVISFDDALGYKHTNSYLIPFRDKESKLYPILPTNSPTYTVSVSDYGNSIAHGTLAGEIATIFLQQIIYIKDHEKGLHKKKKLSSYVEVVDVTEMKNEYKNSTEYHYLPQTYDECKDRFGIIFYDKLQDSERTEPSQSIQEKMTPVHVEQYPFMSVNRISWNPNTWSYLWLGAGYQNGMVRLLHFKYMAPYSGFKTHLDQHAEQMLKKTRDIKQESS